MNVLFVCTMGWLRSRTARDLFDGRDGISAKCCGTNIMGAATPITADLVSWADRIVCMERHHMAAVVEFNPIAPISVLNIPDDYGHMDPELCRMLEACWAAGRIVSR